jgi:hypothetical protein
VGGDGTKGNLFWGKKVIQLIEKGMKVGPDTAEKLWKQIAEHVDESMVVVLMVTVITYLVEYRHDPYNMAAGAARGHGMSGRGRG